MNGSVRLLLVAVVGWVLLPGGNVAGEPPTRRAALASPGRCVSRFEAQEVRITEGHRARDLSRHARRTREVESIELPSGGRLAIRATPQVPSTTVARFRDSFVAGARILEELLGPARMDVEFFLVGVDRLPPSYRVRARRKGPPWARVGVVAFRCPDPCRPDDGQLVAEYHEMVHFWLHHGDLLGGNGYPRWLEEGTADLLADVVARRVGLQPGPRPLPPMTDPGATARALLGWGATAPDFGDRLPGIPDLVDESARYDLAYHVVADVWDRDEGETLVRLLLAFSRRERPPAPDEQERLFGEIAGESLVAVLRRLAEPARLARTDR